MWGSNKPNDSDTTDAIARTDDADLRSSVNDALQTMSDFVNTPRTNVWNLGDLFRVSLSTDPFFGGNSVPTAREYAQCLDQGGRSVWAEDGFWRCLFKGQTLPPHLKHEFTDYTGFLEYQRDLVRRATVDRQLAGRQQQASQLQTDLFKPESASPTSNWSLGSLFSGDSVFPGSDRPRLISEAEAEGKRAISENVSSESVTLDDGTLQTRTKQIRYFDDGTACVKNTTDRGEAKGWFWK